VVSDARQPGRSADIALREQLSNLQALLVLSMLMTENDDESAILNLAATSVPSLGDCRLEGAYLVDRGWQATSLAGAAETRTDLEAQFAVISVAGGAISVVGQEWGWAFALRSIEGHFGFLVVGAVAEPPASTQFLLRVLAQQTGIALANARLHGRERARAEELRMANATLEQTVAALERSTAIHDRLTSVAVGLEGQDGIARAVHELTGFPVAVEDRHGNLRAWAGPDRPTPYPKDDAASRERLLHRLSEHQPVRDQGRLLALAQPREDVIGVLVIIDPEAKADEQEAVALELGATVLAMELARLQSVAETELRIGRDLVEELLAGTDTATAVAHARALGHDLERRHRVVVVDSPGREPDGDVFFHAVRRAVRDTGVGTLLVARGAAVVVLSDTDHPWESLRSAVRKELNGARCRVGVGGPCDQAADFPRSYREAQLTLKLQEATGAEDRASAFDDLGVYRLLSDVEDPKRVERFVRQWLGSLLDYDDHKPTDLVMTLTAYLECGGAYDATAAELSIHRSTLKYRLQRIREISGHDLANPDTQFNLQLACRAWQTLRALRQS
jgi:DNA-binding PucR family transcriptional regulator